MENEAIWLILSIIGNVFLFYSWAISATQTSMVRRRYVKLLEGHQKVMVNFYFHARELIRVKKKYNLLKKKTSEQFLAGDFDAIFAWFGQHMPGDSHMEKLDDIKDVETVYLSYKDEAEKISAD